MCLTENGALTGFLVEVAKMEKLDHQTPLRGFILAYIQLYPQCTVEPPLYLNRTLSGLLVLGYAIAQAVLCACVNYIFAVQLGSRRGGIWALCELRALPGPRPPG